MNFYIVFNNSGDTIPVEATNSDFVTWFIETNNANDCNNFFGADFNKLEDKYSELVRNLYKLKSNKIVQEFCNIDLDERKFVEYFDQKYLNQIEDDTFRFEHTVINLDEVRSIISTANLIISDIYDDTDKEVTVPALLHTIGLDQAFNSIMDYVLSVETNFKNYQMRPDTPKIFNNPFGPSITSFSRPNVGTRSGGIGRPAYFKYRVFGLDDEVDSLSNFEYLHNNWFLTFCAPHTGTNPPEYVEYCKKRNIYPSGDMISLGDIPDLSENIKKYRTILYKNWQEGNPASLEL